MDSGGILCFHYSFCCALSFPACVGDTIDGHPLLSAGVGRQGAETLPRLGAAGEYFPVAACGCDGQ